MKIKKIGSILLTLSLCLAPLNSLAISNDSIPVEPEIAVEDVNEEETSSEESQTTFEDDDEAIQENGARNAGVIYEIVHLSLQVSHFNAHRTYTKIVTRQGKKYEVTYNAIPRSECYLCENGIL